TARRRAGVRFRIIPIRKSKGAQRFLSGGMDRLTWAYFRASPTGNGYAALGSHTAGGTSEKSNERWQIEKILEAPGTIKNQKAGGEDQDKVAARYIRGPAVIKSKNKVRI